MATEFYIHKMSEHMETAQILKWLVVEGERVDKFQIIMEVMTDKVTAEMEAPEAGVIKGIRPGAVDGATVPVGEPICYIAAADEAVPALAPLAGYVAAGTLSPVPAAAETGTSKEEPAGLRASPVARRVAKELGVDLEQVRGTGPAGRIGEGDVREFAASRQAAAVAPSQPAPPPSPAPAAEPAGNAPAHALSATSPIQRNAQDVALTAIQRITGERMRESVVNAPQFALDVAADMTQALWLREQLAEGTGAKLSVTVLLVKVVAAALKRHPRANAEYYDGKLQVYNDINIAVAVGTDDGLVVPVIHNADRKSLVEISAELTAFQEKAKSLRFSADDLAGGTFTISNLGMYGVDGFRAIVNPPQSAILAVGRIAKTPVGLADDTIALRPVMKLTLTVDHRCMDGVQGARFLAEVKTLLEQPHLLLA